MRMCEPSTSASVIIMMLWYLSLSGLYSSFPMPQPSAVISVPTSADASILSNRAFSTLRILPLSGKIAWFFLSLACFADPPAESPSTRNSSHNAGSFSGNLQAFLAGRQYPIRSSCVSCHARAAAASRARAASTILDVMAFAC